MLKPWMTVTVCWILMVGAITACARNAATIDAAPDLAASAAPAAAACYQQNSINPGWTRSDRSEQGCFSEDSCHGGLGYGNGGCYKWAIAADAPPLPWSAELLQEPAGSPLPTDEGLPLEHGLFALHTVCADNPDRCPALRWRATARVPLYSDADPSSPLVGQVRRNEAVGVIEILRLSAPRRGIVEDYPGLSPGDVVYAIDMLCGKYPVLWLRGDVIDTDGGGINWEPPQRLYNPSNGSWYLLERANGQRGWVRANALYEHFAGMVAPRTDEPAPEEDDVDGCE